MYRRAAIRECFEESGILLAKRNESLDGPIRIDEKESELLEIGKEERERVRKEIHGGKKRFQEWVEELGGEIDTGIPSFHSGYIQQESCPFRIFPN